MTTKIYAAYGSNMNVQQMGARCPNAKLIGRGWLKDYELRFAGWQNRGVATVIPKAGVNTPIVLWQISEVCEIALDQYEGFPNLYGKTYIKASDVILESEITKERMEIMFYVLEERYKNVICLPISYYFEIIAKGYRMNGFDLKPLRAAQNRARRGE